MQKVYDTTATTTDDGKNGKTLDQINQESFDLYTKLKRKREHRIISERNWIRPPPLEKEGSSQFNEDEDETSTTTRHQDDEL
mmetsp:Transcript_12075/g.24964  ORF Transcript_12075/g.24964 Transcript_12075/m.24964 type:complete len:82 (+) Transcript_12075:224-469(+)